GRPAAAGPRTAVAGDRRADRIPVRRPRRNDPPRRARRAPAAARARRAPPRARAPAALAARGADVLGDARAERVRARGVRRALRGAARRVPRAGRTPRDADGRDQLRRRRRMKVLRDRRLAALLGAEVVSSLGTQMTWLALPWFVLRTTGSAERMTWVIIAEVLPIAVLGFWGGAIAARVGTRRTMLTCDFVRVPIFAAIPALHAAGALPFPALLALVASSGLFLAPYFSVQRSVVPELIGEEHADVAEATAFFQAANRLTIFLGPPAAGILIGWIGTADVLYVDAATYLASFVLVATFVNPPEVRADGPPTRMLDGVRFLMRDRLLRIWTPAFTLIDVCWQLLFASLPVLVVSHFDADPRVLGWLFGAFGGGA